MSCGNTDKNVLGYLQTGKLGQTNESGVGWNLGNFGGRKVG